MKLTRRQREVLARLRKCGACVRRRSFAHGYAPLRRGKARGAKINVKTLAGLEALGVVASNGDAWRITDAGRRALEENR